MHNLRTNAYTHEYSKNTDNKHKSKFAKIYRLWRLLHIIVQLIFYLLFSVSVFQETGSA